MGNEKTVILDTNFLIDFFRFSVSFEDVEDVVGGKCDFLVAEQTLHELQSLKSKYSKVALKMIEKMGIGVIKSDGDKSGNADDAILDFLKKKSKTENSEDFIVATNDARLRKRIKKLGSKVIYLRARKHLEISNE